MLNNLKSNILVTLLVFVILSLYGCAHPEPCVQGAISKPVKTSGDLPGWVTSDKAYWVEDEKMFFKVQSDNEADLDFGLRGLDGQSYVAIINNVKVRAGAEFDEAVKGSKYNQNTIGNARQSVVNAIGDVTFSGLAKDLVYWEQVERTERCEPRQVAQLYNLRAVYTIPETEMKRAREEAWTKAKETVVRQADVDAQKVLDEAKEIFLKGGK